MIARTVYSLLLGLLLTTASQASQILWGSARLALNYRSSGAPATLDSGFTFQLGAFEPGFVPTASNTDDWLDKWTPAQSAKYNDRTRFFTGSHVYQQNVSPFLPSNQGYIFGFNRWSTSEGGDRAEWILATDPKWRWPSGGGISLPVQWSMSNASNIVLGSVDPPSESFHMMTADIDLPTSALSFELWSKRFLQDGSTASLSADSDHDGRSNGLEFAFSTNPARADVGPQTSATFVYENGDAFLEIELFKIGIREGVTLGAEVSTDLANWEHAGDTVELIEDSILIYRVRATEPANSGRTRFYRLAAALNL
ncbi:MAG: hypothetical protein ACI8T1_002885 [Verrucomicrobiales bacterium]|jgi:hypothetical protein